MEQDFDVQIVSSSQMNGMLSTYESSLVESYGDAMKKGDQ